VESLPILTGMTSGPLVLQPLQWHHLTATHHMAEILLSVDDQHTSEAGNWIKKASEAHKRDGLMWDLGRDYALHAELLKRAWSNRADRYGVGCVYG